MKSFPHIFLAGIPASGKSYFGRWLEAEHGYLHIDAEIPNELERLSLRDSWNEACNTHNCSHFAEVLRECGKPIVFNWGFPVGCLPLAVALKRTGFSVWWFDADVSAARTAYIAGGKSVQDFDIQVRDIQVNMIEIVTQLTPNTIFALTAAGNRMTPSKILSAIKRVA